MGRSVQPNKFRRAMPSGGRWSTFRAWLFSDQCWTATPLCAACQHRILPRLGEVQHQVPPQVAPALRYVVSNLRPVHGGGRRRCPQCNIACNYVLAANHAPRDASGCPVLPWTAEFIARKSRERAERTREVTPGFKAPAPAVMPPPRPEPHGPPGPGEQQVGRVW